MFRTFSVSVPFQIGLLQETGKWEGKTAGGCGNGASRETWQYVHSSACIFQYECDCFFLFRNNPLYQLSLEESSDENVLLIDLKGPKQYSVGFEVRQVSSPRNKSFERKDSGVYRYVSAVVDFDFWMIGSYYSYSFTPTSQFSSIY